MKKNIIRRLSAALLLIVGAMTMQSLWAQEASIQGIAGPITYNKLQDALDAARDGQVITLLEEIRNHQYKPFVIDKSIIINLNDKIVEADFELKSDDITLRSGKLYGSVISEAKKATLEGIWFYKSKDIDGIWNETAVQCKSGILNIKSCSLFKGYDGPHAEFNSIQIDGGKVKTFNCSFSEKILVGNGTFVADLAHIYQLKFTAAHGDVILTDCTLTLDNTITIDRQNKVTLYGGTIGAKYKDDNAFRLTDQGSLITHEGNPDNYEYSHDPEFSGEGTIIAATDDATIELTKSTLQSQTTAVALSGNAAANFKSCTIETTGIQSFALKAEGKVQLNFDKTTVKNSNNSSQYSSGALYANGQISITSDKATSFRTAGVGRAVNIMTDNTEFRNCTIFAPKGYGILMRGDNVVVEDCDIEAKWGIVADGQNICLGKGNDVDCSSVCVQTNSSELTINGGQYHLDYYCNEGGLLSALNVGSSITVKNGCFDCNEDKEYDTTGKGKIWLKGGYYVLDPTAVLNKFNGGANYKVRKTPSSLQYYIDGYYYCVYDYYPWRNMSRGGLGYPTLQEALDDVNYGNVIKLCSDIYSLASLTSSTDSDPFITCDKGSIELDLDGYTIDCNHFTIWWDNSFITVRNGTIRTSPSSLGTSFPILYFEGNKNTLRNLTLECNRGPALAIQPTLEIFDLEETLENCRLTGKTHTCQFYNCPVKATNCSFIAQNIDGDDYGRALEIYGGSYHGQGCTYIGLSTSSSKQSLIFAQGLNSFEDTGSELISTSLYTYGINLSGCGNSQLNNLTSKTGYTTATIQCDSSPLTLQNCQIEIDKGTIVNSQSSKLLVRGGDYFFPFVFVTQTPSSEADSIIIYDGQFIGPNGGLLTTFKDNSRTLIHNGLFNIADFRYYPSTTPTSLRNKGTIQILGGYYKPNPTKYLAPGLTTRTPSGFYGAVTNYYVQNNDVNGDGKHSIVDVVLANEITKISFSRFPKLNTMGISRTAADVDGDGEVTNDDIDGLARKVLRFNDEDETGL